MLRFLFMQDPVVYTKDELKDLLAMVHEGMHAITASSDLMN